MEQGFLFDPDKARGGDDTPDVGKAHHRKPAPPPRKAPLSVSALIAAVKGALTQTFPQKIQVVGEISGFKHHTSGHMYFRLKDADASIDVAMFRQHAGRLKFRPEDGMEVVAEGRVDVYEVRGQLQLYVEKLTPKGAGALELAFRQLKEKLQAEGMFAPEAKKPIKRFPRAVGIVTSETGAALRDIRRTLQRRWPAVDAYLLPVLVQGDGAAGQIAEAVRLLDANAERLKIDTIIVARGGGSLEDLWAFNEELVARAIFAARTPIISGVGHEVDVTIADMAADLRAPTPTGAAELAVPDAREIAEQIAHLSQRLTRTVAGDVARAKAQLDAISRSAVFRDPAARLRTQTQRIDELSIRIKAALSHSLAQSAAKLAQPANRLAGLHPAILAERAGAKLDNLLSRLRWSLGARSKRSANSLASAKARLAAVHPKYRLKLATQHVTAIRRQLESMSYRNVLARGFSVTRTGDGDILRSVADVDENQHIYTELADGQFTSTVDKLSSHAKPKE